ncbi:hypothetical protein ACFWUU_40365 [Kribbella sp. NPDC058693]|uniref:hypothetical protein n=1 Tax=Kribbella sp. NPDC058693 TaxID=3346602 RepID=UPI0036473E6B
MPDKTTTVPLTLYPNLLSDATTMPDYMDTVLYALSVLRSGSLQLDGSRDPATMKALADCLIGVSERLRPRLEGIIDALLVAHRAAGGSWAELSDDAGQALGTLRSRVKRIETEGSYWAEWARGDHNQHLGFVSVDLPAPAEQEGPVARLMDSIEREAAADAAAERAGNGVRLPNHGATFDLGEQGVAFLDTPQPLTPAKGFPAVGELTLAPEQEVSVYPGPEEGWWLLRMFLRGQYEPLVFTISRTVAAELLAAATADAARPE